MAKGGGDLSPFGRKALGVSSGKQRWGPVEPVVQNKKLSRTPIDPAVSWAANVADLHRVFGAAQSLFLTLSQHDEAIVRVALELITAKKSKHIFKWMDDWYDDDDRRLWFGNAVQEKLKYVLDVRNGKLSAKEGDDCEFVDLATHRAVLKRAEDAEAALEELKIQMRNAELLSHGSSDTRQQMEQKDDQIKHLQERLRQANSSLAETDERCEDLDEKLQDALKAKSEVDSGLEIMTERKRSAEEQVRSLEGEAESLRTTCAQLREESTAFEQTAANHFKEVVALRAELEALKSSQGQVADMRRRIDQLNAEVSTHKAAAEAADARAAECETLRATSADTKTRAHALETELNDAQEKSNALEARFAELEAEAEALRRSKDELANRSPGLVANQAVQTDGAMCGSEGDAEMQEKINTLTAQNKRLKVALEELQQKMQDLIAECRRRGVDIDDILSNLGLEPVAEVRAVWDRLYDEAAERVARMEKRRHDFYQEHAIDILPSCRISILSLLEQSEFAEEMARRANLAEEIPERRPSVSSMHAHVTGGGFNSTFSKASRFGGGPMDRQGMRQHGRAPPHGQKKQSHSADNLRSSSGFGRKSKSKFFNPSGVHSHLVPRKGSSGKMRSSLGFSQAMQIVSSQTKASTGASWGPNVQTATSQTKVASYGQAQQAIQQAIRNSAMTEAKTHRHAGDHTYTKALEQKAPRALMRNRMASSLPTIAQLTPF
jgi:predicted  nucleic acid-binding Zn-ribbon protein